MHRRTSIPESRGETPSEEQNFYRVTGVERRCPSDSWISSLCGGRGDLSSGRPEDPESQAVPSQRGFFWRTCRPDALSEPNCGFGADHASAVVVGGVSLADPFNFSDADGELAAGFGLLRRPEGTLGSGSAYGCTVDVADRRNRSLYSRPVSESAEPGGVRGCLCSGGSFASKVSENSAVADFRRRRSSAHGELCNRLLRLAYPAGSVPPAGPWFCG